MFTHSVQHNLSKFDAINDLTKVVCCNLIRLTFRIHMRVKRRKQKEAEEAAAAIAAKKKKKKSDGKKKKSKKSKKKKKKKKTGDDVSTKSGKKGKKKGSGANDDLISELDGTMIGDPDATMPLGEIDDEDEEEKDEDEGDEGAEEDEAADKIDNENEGEDLNDRKEPIGGGGEGDPDELGSPSSPKPRRMIKIETGAESDDGKEQMGEDDEGSQVLKPIKEDSESNHNDANSENAAPAKTPEEDEY